MSQSKTNQKPSIKNALSYLLLKTESNPTPMKRYSFDQKTPTDPRRGIAKLERFFLKEGDFEWAILYDNQTGEKIAYYHPSTKDQPISLPTYNKLLGKSQIKLYIIYTSTYKLRTGRTKGLTMPIEDLKEVEQYWNQDVQRIMIYQNQRHTHNFINGQFFTV
jgi:hypothetical protein